MNKLISCILIIVLSLVAFVPGCFADDIHNNPIIAGALSLILPGLGQVYNTQIGKGVLFFLGWSICLTGAYGGNRNDNRGLLYGSGTAALVIQVWSIYDAYINASRVNRKYSFTSMQDGLLNLSLKSEPGVKMDLSLPKMTYNYEKNGVHINLVDFRF